MGRPPLTTQLTGDEAVLLNCNGGSCQWELKNYTEAFGVGCKAKLRDGYKYPDNFRKPKFQKISPKNYSKGNLKAITTCFIPFYSVYVLFLLGSY